MGNNKKGVEANNMDSSSDEDFDSADSDSSDSDNEITQDDSQMDVIPEDDDNDEQIETVEEEEEDEVIKAIKAANTKQRDHPPIIQCEDYIVDISFHPQEDLIGVGSITGDVFIYKYTNEENSLLHTLELHMKACRDIEFSDDGKLLFSTSKDKSIMLSDVETCKLIKFFDDAHDNPIYTLSVLNENLFATGDDDGRVKLWDLREKNTNCVFTIKKNEDYISDICTHEEEKYLLCSSGDGSLTTVDLKNRKFFMQSEEYEEELTCLGLFRTETKLLAGSNKGKMFLYNWNEFGLHSDEFAGPKTAINDLVPITENIVVTACEDGNLRAAHLFPHRHLGIVGQHNLSIENVDISNNGSLIASSSHNNDIRFWNIQYFEDFEKVDKKHNKHNKKKDMKNNLPSSQRRNNADFFSDLC
ncbi:WD repeat-containing protein 55 homolog [Onthophagus taurus]|uniref:WD repeat-containing protein 55 homolog n=1 Tax=Onthophagus taurus TaxID=166361 RepID=UPI0039BE30E1